MEILLLQPFTLYIKMILSWIHAVTSYVNILSIVLRYYHIVSKRNFGSWVILKVRVQKTRFSWIIFTLALICFLLSSTYVQNFLLVMKERWYLIMFWLWNVWRLSCKIFKNGEDKMMTTFYNETKIYEHAIFPFTISLNLFLLFHVNIN